MTTALNEKIQADNMITWLETEALKFGTENQRERWSAMMLPEDELLQLARAELFKGFEGIPRWNTREHRKQMEVSIRHRYCVDERDCDCTVCAYSKKHPQLNAPRCWSLHFEVTDVGELGAAEWERLKTIQALTAAASLHPWMFRAKATASVESCTHWLTCPNCEAELARSVAKVSIPWAGRTLVREYAL